MPDGTRTVDRVLITGANGSLGQQLLRRLCSPDEDPLSPALEARAVVRSAAAAASIERLPLQSTPRIGICDYSDHKSLARAAESCRFAVHLVGILKQSGKATYTAAHEDTCRALVRAAESAGLEHIVYLSILGSRPDSPNPCLASKGRAEAILLDGSTATTVLRVPMVVGPNDPASRALRAQARSRFVFLVGGGRTLQQPIDSRDVIAAILASLHEAQNRVLELAGPERLRHRELVRRVAALHAARPTIVPLPRTWVRSASRLMERFLPEPPLTPAMLDVLEQDDRVDEAEACASLGLRLTPLDETLRQHVGPGSESA